jgi:branched-chain amino acid transport system substrate-binding protein
MRPVLTSVAASGAEIMFFPIFPPEGNFIALQTQEVEGFDGITLMGADGLLTSPFFDAVGAQGQGMYFVGPDTPGGSAYDAFVSNFEATYGELPVTPFHAHSSDAINLLLEAITAVAVQDAREVGRLHIGRQALRDALSATAGYRGLTGNLSCDQFGDCGASRFKVMRFDDPVAGLEGLARNVVFTYAPD